MIKAAIPKTVTELIQRFEYNFDSYRANQYKETQLRREFVDPFFIALQWDVNNERGYAEAYKDVIHEDSIRIGGKVKAPDYCFRIGGARKFFIEVKKPSVNIKEDVNPAFQLRRYAWSSKLPLSLLTDFEEFAIYDCRIKPVKTDKASTARIFYCTYKDYVKQWNEIYSIFSREEILRGSFDKYAESNKAKRGTAEVDSAFLKEIETWRDMLAKNIAIRNPELTQKELNYTVQMTIDRIIFLRICEDRGIEPYGKLQTTISSQDIYRQLCVFFNQADDKYNSGLFYFRKEKDRVDSTDDLSLKINIDDKVLKEIIKNLYYPDSPYEFSVLPSDILGQVYEQFLGKVIRLTPGHRAVVEYKPEAKKAGGVYYTPTYIVDYIVKNTVGKLLEGKTPKQADTLRILDPACGSGSFLIEAYQYLLDWYLDMYIEASNKKSRGIKDKIYQGAGGDWKLTVKERKRILINNIYGVDIDHQAVEVTKLSLLLKVLEEETDDTLSQQFIMFHKERALPNLAKNIKCGNSLIGSDFYQDKDMSLFGEDEMIRINTFDWNIEFPEIFQGNNPGFDAVIGNPPYVRQEMLGNMKSYFQKQYQVYHGVADLYAYFIEKGISLLNSSGFFGYIVSNKWIRANYGKPLRQWLKQQQIESIIDFGDLPVFQQATTYPCILIVANQQIKNLTCEITTVKTLKFANLKTYVEKNCFKLRRNSLDDNSWSLVNEQSKALLDKLYQKGLPFGKYVNGKVYRGILTGLNEAFIIDAYTREKLINDDPKSEELIKPFLIGRDIKRYQSLTSERYLIFTKREVDIQQYPVIKQYLSKYKEKLTPKPKGWKGEKWQGRKPGLYQWYEIQDTIAYYKEFEKPKIIYPNICKKPEFTYDNNGLYTNQKCFIISLSDKYLLGILNSKLTFFLFQVILPKLRGDFYEPSYVYFKEFPIHTIDFNNPTDKANHDKMVSLVDEMLTLNKQLHEATLPQIKTVLQRKIEATDKQIDSLVYELYGLTDKEIKIIEDSS